MKRISSLLGLFILAILLCGPAGTLSQTEPTKTKSVNQPQTPIVATVELTREFTSTKMPDIEIEPTAPLREASAARTPEAAPAEPDENPVASTARPQPIAESKPSEPPVKEPAPANSQSGSGLPGFDYVPYLGPNVVIYLEDMYENGNKIGIMGDINKQVGIMD